LSPEAQAALNGGPDRFRCRSTPVPCWSGSPTAAINGSVSTVADPAWTFGGQPLAPVGNIPVTRIRVRLPMGDGGQDAVWDSAAAASTIMGELRARPA